MGFFMMGCYNLLDPSTQAQHFALTNPKSIRYASVTPPAFAGQAARRRLRSQTFGLSMDSLFTATLRLVMEPAEKGQVPRRGFASQPSVFLWTPYGPRRFKGPFGSSLIVPTFPHGASASRSRSHRIVSFRRRAILRRFVPHPRKMANTRRLVLAKASHPLTNRRGRLVPPTSGSAPWVQFPQTRRSARPFQAPRKNSDGSSRPRSPASRDWYWRAARGMPVTAIGPGSKFRPDRCRRLLRPATTRDHAPLAGLHQNLLYLGWTPY